MKKKLYKLNVIQEYVPCGESYGYTGRRHGLYFSHEETHYLLHGEKYSIPAPTEIYINLYDIASIEEHKYVYSSANEDYTIGYEERTDGYILKMSTGIYLISVEDGKKIIDLLGCVQPPRPKGRGL